MKYQDPVYGEVVLDPVLLELIESSPVKRLRNISQHGASIYNKYFNKRIVSRFEHSVGVAILMKKLNRSIEEQISGLLHDVGHAVFSHVVDFVFTSKDQDYDKKHHQELIINSGIPKIISRYKIDISYILDDKNFPIMEKDLPDLCGDRADYFLRDPFCSIKAEKAIKQMAIKKETLVFVDKKTARDFSEDFAKVSGLFWREDFHEYLYFTLAEIIKIAMEEKILKYQDLYLTEPEVIKILKNSKNKEISKLFDILENSHQDKIEVSSEKIDQSYLIKSKARIIDPLVYLKGELKRLSQIDDDYRNLYQEKLTQWNKPRFIRLKN